jgi:hypothetical protein
MFRMSGGPPSGIAYWVHKATGEVWAIETDQGDLLVRGVGPIPAEYATSDVLPRLQFHTRLIAWVSENWERFDGETSTSER